MVKNIIFQILNSFRIIAFWLLIPFLFIGGQAAIRESKVEITIKETVLGERINHYASGQEFQCVVDGRSVVVVDHYEHEEGDTVELIYRNGELYGIRNEEFPEIGVDLGDRVRYKYTEETKGNDAFILMALILFTILTIKSRKEFRKKYFIPAIVTHVAGVLMGIFFIMTCFWLECLVPIFYAVTFAIFWIIWIIVKNIKNASGGNETK